MGFFCGLLLGLIIGFCVATCTAQNVFEDDLKKLTNEELKKKYLK